jgi:hypothetical protein
MRGRLSTPQNGLYVGTHTLALRLVSPSSSRDGRLRLRHGRDPLGTHRGW